MGHAGALRGLVVVGVMALALGSTGCASLAPEDAAALVAYDRAARLHLVESRYQRSGVERFQDAPIRIR